ncbi:hypothetical protein L1D15_02550 [Vibrio sp. Isolate25]|uniref:hypothetical protein n=1 Tax=Vibrio sp. Isolate25 TaxID=2908535 RepID=UPI001EFE4E01|nr:hypothetical protein [Vibrio sp. Isolate25]MCG9595597.1 hypothetical protein [Vibrio sp. Isolate25]
MAIFEVAIYRNKLSVSFDIINVLVKKTLAEHGIKIDLAVMRRIKGDYYNDKNKTNCNG